MTSATEELCRMLDERGVEYESETEEDGWAFTRWHGFDDTGWLAMSDEICGLLDLRGRYLFTPAQAIAATLGDEGVGRSNDGVAELGAGTCHDEGDPTDFCCSECGVRMFTETNDTYTMIASDGRTIIKHPNYCPNCGAKVVDDG